MFVLDVCRRGVSCCICKGPIPAGQQHPAIQEQRRFTSYSRYCRDCAFTRLRPKILDEIRRLQAIEAGIAEAVVATIAAQPAEGP